MKKQPLIKLIDDLDQEMLKLGYKKSSMAFYRWIWRKLLQFAQEHGKKVYSDQLGTDFLKQHFHIFEKGILLPPETMKLRAIRVIRDFQLHHLILRRYHPSELLADQYFIKISMQFKEYCILKDYSKATVNHYVRKAERFINYLNSRHIRNVKEINITLIHAYIETLTHYAYESVEANICSIRTFFLSFVFS